MCNKKDTILFYSWRNLSDTVAFFMKENPSSDLEQMDELSALYGRLF